MPKSLEITITFRKEYAHLYDFLKARDNTSLYVCRLVEADMTQSSQKLGLDAIRGDIRRLEMLLLQRPAVVEKNTNLSAAPALLSELPDENLAEMLGF